MQLTIHIFVSPMQLHPDLSCVLKCMLFCLRDYCIQKVAIVTLLFTSFETECNNTRSQIFLSRATFSDHHKSKVQLVI